MTDGNCSYCQKLCVDIRDFFKSGLIWCPEYRSLCGCKVLCTGCYNDLIKIDRKSRPFCTDFNILKCDLCTRKLKQNIYNVMDEFIIQTETFTGTSFQTVNKLELIRFITNYDQYR